MRPPPRPRPPVRLALLAAACALALPAADARGQGARRAAAPGRAEAALVAEARAFMEAYGRDLRAGDRAAVAARYDRAGAYELGNGRKRLVPYDSIVARYAREWNPPASFEWDDLSFEPVGPDAVVVAGRFRWGVRAGAPPAVMSYTGLLRRRGGALRIRLEDESPDPATMPARPAPADPARR